MHYRVQNRKAVDFNHLLYFFFNFTSQTLPWYSKWSPRQSFRIKTHFIYDSLLRDACHMLRPSNLLHLMTSLSKAVKNYKVFDYAIFYDLLLGQTFVIREAVGTCAIPKMMASQITGKLLEWASTAVITNRWQEKTTITHESIHDQ